MVELVKNKWTIGLVLITIVLSLSVILLGNNIKFIKNNPKEVYAVYLDGKKIGVVSSVDDFNGYINEQENKLKEKYNVNTIYTPKGVEIKKTITYDDKIDSNEKIYRDLVDTKNFTIKGIEVTITYSKEEEKDPLVINVLNKDIFDDAILKLIKAFVNEEVYDKFMSSSQEEIVDVGEIVESIYIKEKVTYREDYISTDEEIFVNADDLTKYLLYGTTEEQDTYVVKYGDTIADVAMANKLNTQEFLIANTSFTSENNLLYEGQVVNVGLINPVLSIVVEKHGVALEVHKYATDIKYDSDLVVGYSYVEREGEDGLDKVTRKYQYINGQLADVALVGSIEIKPSLSQILVKGDKYIPYVADLSYWAWPTSKPYTISSGYGYRWGSFHDAIDIYVGHGSAIYAANNGTVESVGTGCVVGDLNCNGKAGNNVIINHNVKGYYTAYMHMDKVYVRPGQTVSRGQKIGTMGNTGNVFPIPAYGSNSVAGTHLHFGVWIGSPPSGGGYHVNPYSLY